ncbi:MAG TPA: energy transducer TonB [Blastocatellia bacterium]|nr:energy transducer TonB [Blastocatellia bacterium]
MLNNTGKGIARILVLFTDVNGRERARLVSWADAGPHSPFAVGYDGQGQPEVLQSSARPYELSAVVSEVLFEDGFVWDMEHPRGLMDVDTEPELLERPHAQYTENALQKRIQGPVRMRLLLSADGTVKEVKVMCPLPDGLDESATREAYGLRFKPATKNGKPVECLLVFEIEFVLPTRRRGPGNPN